MKYIILLLFIVVSTTLSCRKFKDCSSKDRPWTIKMRDGNWVHAYYVRMTENASLQVTETPCDPYYIIGPYGYDWLKKN